ncbi:MAG: hypothetical protein WEA54_02065 [Actinomycetota bacterium]
MPTRPRRLPPARERIVAGLVALTVFVAGGFVLVRAFSSDSPGPFLDIVPGRVDRIPDVAVVTCTQRGTQVTPKVRPQGDGVHVRVEGADGRAVINFHGSQPDESVPVGSERALDAPGSPNRVVCRLSSSGDAPVRADAFRVVDPAELYWPMSPECDAPVERVIDIGETAETWEGEEGFPSLVRVVRNGLPGVRPSDEVRVPGWPERNMWRVPIVAVRRDGLVVATVSSFDLREVIHVCPGTGIAEPEQP